VKHLTPIESRVWSTYVAVGDSFTEGMSDPDPETDDAYIGWADRLAESLSDLAQMEHLPFHYANLAVRGRMLSDVVGPQLDRALSMSPDLVSIVGGGNDLLRPSVDTNALMDTIEQAVIRARQSGADVLLATPVDPQQGGCSGPCEGGTPSTRPTSSPSPSGTGATSSTSGGSRPCATGASGPTTGSTSRPRATAGWRWPR
jgi:hypothetical protein